MAVADWEKPFPDVRYLSLLPSQLLQLFLGNSESFSVQMGNVIPPTCSALTFSSQLDVPEMLPEGEVSSILIR